MSQKHSTFSQRFPQGFGHRLAVALYQPEIPLNVGSIARTCACTAVPLHLVGTLGFRPDERLARHYGLDYWELADVCLHPDWDEFAGQMHGRRMWLFSTSGERAFWDVTYEPGDILVFGNESSGLPQGILEPNRERCLVIPMEPSLRSLNLSNAVAVALYEALRQLSVRLLSGRPERKD